MASAVVNKNKNKYECIFLVTDLTWITTSLLLQCLVPTQRMYYI